MHRLRISVSSLFLACCVTSNAGDWPHQRGPQQNGIVAPDSKFPATLPDDPRIVWKTPATDGFAAPIVSGDRVFFGDLQNGKEVFHAVQLSDAKELWHDVLDDPHIDGFGTGPRCAPVSDGEIVLTQSCKGELHCLDASTGKLLWEKNYQSDFGALYVGEKGTSEGGARHGYNASPCIDGDHVIALAGGIGSGVLCFEKKTGAIVWKSLDDQAAYSPPVVATLAGVEQIVCFTVQGLVGVDREDGKELWRVPMSTDFGRHIVAPVIHGDIVIVGSHQVGLVATRIVTIDGVISAKEAWKHDKELGPNVTSPVCIGYHIYLLAKTDVVCLDAKTGKLAWSQGGNIQTSADKAFAAFIGIGKSIMMLNDMGELILFKADPTAYTEISRTQVCGKNWCHPAYADGMFVVRDAKNLICVDLLNEE
ncbi:MAG: PQQ-like beta-propeller repeat protein [Verrucomicrobia bacterium]|nr:PQQ-like beta-propeller repeat protein [Verrucomicrobiota bacterium]